MAVILKDSRGTGAVRRRCWDLTGTYSKGGPERQAGVEQGCQTTETTHSPTKQDVLWAKIPYLPGRPLSSGLSVSAIRRHLRKTRAVTVLAKKRPCNAAPAVIAVGCVMAAFVSDAISQSAAAQVRLEAQYIASVGGIPI